MQKSALRRIKMRERNSGDYSYPDHESTTFDSIFNSALFCQSNYFS